MRGVEDRKPAPRPGIARQRERRHPGPAVGDQYTLTPPPQARPRGEGAKLAGWAGRAGEG